MNLNLYAESESLSNITFLGQEMDVIAYSLLGVVVGVGVFFD